MPDDRDPLLDPPASTPDWVPRVDNERSITWLRRGVVAVFVLGLLAFVVRGADRPADPVVGATPGRLPGAAAAGQLPGIASRVPIAGFGEIAVAVTDAKGKVIGWCLLTADTTTQRQRGLMEVTDLRGYPGMLFRFKADQRGGFYMRNTPMPLSIAWFAADGTFVSSADMDPCADIDGCKTYDPTGSYRFAIEVPQGKLAEMGIGPGSTIYAGGKCIARSA
jgi:uncharacterized membrane protein (UPF0127 family)